MEHSYFFITMIYLAAAVIFIPLARKLGLGSVLGYLLAGMVIGPSMLGFIGQEGQDIMHFAEFGVVMMLFLIGLELEPALLWNMRAPILGLGGLQVLITTSVITGGALLLGQPLNASLALGMTLSLSSTAIVLQSLKEKGILSSSAGQSSFSVLLFQDIAVIPMLAIFPLLAGISSTHTDDGHTLRDDLPAWGQTLMVLGAVVVIIVAGRYLIKALLRIVARARVRELFTAFALLLVVSISVLMSLVGLSPALGAFLGGVVLANSEYRHELESDVEPFKGLLLGLFFMAVGASIDFKLVLSIPWVIIGLVAALMALKAIILLTLGKVFRISIEQNLLFGVALSQVGEFAFVLLSFTNQYNILPQATVSIMTAVVAISMAFTPLLMMLYERVIQPRFNVADKNTRQPDEIHLQEKHPVIIAGFGRFGNIVGRFLRVNGIKATILDLDSDRVDALHNLGVKVYYGDASRHDLLEAAGAADAKIIIIAMDTVEQTLEVVKVVRKHFPHLQMLVKAENIPDTYELMDLGVLHIYRETLDTSLRMGADALNMLGIRAYHAHRTASTFRKQEDKALKGLSAIRNDKKLYINTVKERIEELEKLMTNDKVTRWNSPAQGWDESSLINEANEDQ